MARRSKDCRERTAGHQWVVEGGKEHLRGLQASLFFHVYLQSIKTWIFTAVGGGGQKREQLNWSSKEYSFATGLKG